MKSTLLIGLLFVALAARTLAEELPSLRIGVAAGAAPMAFFDRGVLRGLAIDLARDLASDLDRELQLQEMPEARLVDALRGGRIDLVLATLPDTELQALGLAASTPVLETGQMALIRSADFGDFRRLLDLMTTSRRVGYEWGTAGARFAQSSLPNAERVPFPDAAAAVEALRAGDIDVLIHEATTVWGVATNADEQALMGIFQPLTEERLAWITRAEDELLRREIDRALALRRESGELDRLINRWIRVQVEVAH